MFARTKPHPTAPAYWQAYQAGTSPKLPRRTPIDTLRFVVVDTETDGFEHNQLVSIGYVPVQNNLVLTSQSKEFVVQSQQPLATEGIAVHGIMPAQCQVGVPVHEALQHCLHDFTGATLVGHRIAYDIQVLNNALKGMVPGKLVNPVIDTYDLAVRVAGSPVATAQNEGKKYGLDSLCQQYHIPCVDRHTAAGDAFITAQLLLKLLAKLRHRGVTTYGQLAKRRFTLWG